MRDAAHRFGLPAFLRWWADELASLVPARTWGAVQRRRVRSVLAFGTDAAVLWVPRMHEGAIALAETARIPLAGDAAAVQQAGRAAIAALPAHVYGGPVSAAKVVIALPRGQVLRKRLVLPAAVEENLKQALAYDLDRHTPFRPDQLYFDAVVVERNVERKELRVDWAAVLKSVADPACRMAESWGATVVGIVPDAVEGEAISPIAMSKLNLLPEEARGTVPAWKRWQWWGPLALLVAVGLVALVLPIWQKRNYAIALTVVADKARLEAEAADAVRQQVDQSAADFNFALGQKYAFPGAVQLLEDVTRVLPDDTWLTQFEMRTTARGKESRREIVLRGESANAGRIVSLLEESKLFNEPAPRSPTTKIQPGPGEIFDVGAQLRRLPAPAPTVLGSDGPIPTPAPVLEAVAPSTSTPEKALAGAVPPVAETAPAPEASPSTTGAQAPAVVTDPADAELPAPPTQVPAQIEPAPPVVVAPQTAMPIPRQATPRDQRGRERRDRRDRGGGQDAAAGGAQ